MKIVTLSEYMNLIEKKNMLIYYNLNILHIILF